MVRSDTHGVCYVKKHMMLACIVLGRRSTNHAACQVRSASGIVGLPVIVVAIHRDQTMEVQEISLNNVECTV